MPLYEYECESCGTRFEKIRKFSDPPVDVCSNCGKGPVKKLLSSPAIQFKGSGWYITDYAKKSTTDAKSTKDAPKESKETPASTGDSKPAQSSDKKD